MIINEQLIFQRPEHLIFENHIEYQNKTVKTEINIEISQDGV